MKLFTYLIILGLIGMCIGCKPKPVQQQQASEWTALTIQSEDNAEIIVYPDSDTVTVHVYHTASFFSPPKKVTVDTLRIVFPKAERDSIFYLVKDIITAPPPVSGHCTEFIGDLRVKIYYGETLNQGVDYSGVCNWNRLSLKTMQLHNILKRRIKKVFLGETNIKMGPANY